MITKTTNEKAQASNTNVWELLKTQLHLIAFLRKDSDCLLDLWFAMVLGVLKVAWVHIYVSACAQNYGLLL